MREALKYDKVKAFIIGVSLLFTLCLVNLGGVRLSAVRYLGGVRLSAARPASDDKHPHEFVDKTPLSSSSLSRGWVLVGPAPLGALLQLTVMLRPADPDALYRLAAMVSDPAHEQYGKHQNLGKIAKLCSVPSDHIRAVENWLAASGILLDQVHRNPGDDLWTVNATVSEANQLLAASYNIYRHPDPSNLRTFVLRTQRYSLPRSVASIVDWVGPTTTFPMITSITAIREAAGPSEGLVAPPYLRKLYDIPADTFGSTRADNVQAVVAFLGMHAPVLSDLDTFLAEYDTSGGQELSDPALRPHFAGINRSLGQRGAEEAGLESALDLEYLMGLAPGVRTVFYYYDQKTLNSEGARENEPFLDWLTQVGRTDDIPNVFSVSYADWESSVPAAYAARVNLELAKLAARGRTVVVASGDGGVEGAGHLPHYAYKGHDCKRGDPFLVSFPASSPWVTAVGATTGTRPEVGAPLSGGGFSRVFQRPSWQQAHVEGYLKCRLERYDVLSDSPQKRRAVQELRRFCSDPTLRSLYPPLPNATQYSPHGRGIPDVSAQGLGVQIFFGGQWTHVDGTSASTPIVGAIVSLLNDARIAAGHSPMGFLNPWLYSPAVAQGGGIVDVTGGNNPGCESDGYFASKGWDPVTGLGTLRFEALRRLALDAVVRGATGTLSELHAA